jgi:hypothetical protein
LGGTVPVVLIAAIVLSLSGKPPETTATRRPIAGAAESDKSIEQDTASSKNNGDPKPVQSRDAPTDDGKPPTTATRRPVASAADSDKSIEQDTASPKNNGDPKPVQPRDAPTDDQGSKGDPSKAEETEEPPVKDSEKTARPGPSRAWTELTTMLTRDWRKRDAKGVKNAQDMGFDVDKLKVIWTSYQEGIFSPDQSQMLATAAFHEAGGTKTAFTDSVLVPGGATEKAIQDSESLGALARRLLLYSEANELSGRGCPADLLATAWSIHEEDCASEPRFRRALLQCLVGGHETFKDSTLTGDLVCLPGSLKSTADPVIQEQMVRRITLNRIMKISGAHDRSASESLWKRFISAGQTEAAFIEVLETISPSTAPVAVRPKPENKGPQDTDTTSEWSVTMKDGSAPFVITQFTGDGRGFKAQWLGGHYIWLSACQDGVPAVAEISAMELDPSNGDSFAQFGVPCRHIRRIEFLGEFEMKWPGRERSHRLKPWYAIDFDSPAGPRTISGINAIEYVRGKRFASGQSADFAVALKDVKKVERSRPSQEIAASTSPPIRVLASIITARGLRIDAVERFRPESDSSRSETLEISGKASATIPFSQISEIRVTERYEDGGVKSGMILARTGESIPFTSLGLDRYNGLQGSIADGRVFQLTSSEVQNIRFDSTK